MDLQRPGGGGEGGIRTPDTREGMPDFESGAIDRTLPPLHSLFIINEWLAAAAVDFVRQTLVAVSIHGLAVWIPISAGMIWC
jgi:hypothetical protein